MYNYIFPNIHIIIQVIEDTGVCTYVYRRNTYFSLQAVIMNNT